MSARDQYRARLQAGVIGWVRAIFGALVYSTVLFYGYRDFVSPTYAYEGLTYRTPDPWAYAGAVGLVVLVAICLSPQIRYPSDFVIWIVFIVAGAPSILLGQYMDIVTVDEATRTGLAVAGCMILIRAGARVRPRVSAAALPKIDPDALWLLMVLLALGVYGALIATLGLNLRWVTFDDVYTVRASYKLAAASVPFMGYVLPVVYNVINPVFIARGIYSRRWRWVAFGATGQLIIYMTTAQKAVLFSVPAMFGIAWLYRRAKLRLDGLRLMNAFSLVAVGAVIIDKLAGATVWSNLLIRRFLVIPGALTIAYVAVFDQRPKSNFAGTPLFWLPEPSGRGPSYLVGDFLTGNANTNANASLFGHGFYSYGYLGMFIESAVLVVILWAIDAACRGLPTPVAALVLFMPAFTIASANVFTSLTTHGLAAAIIVLAVLPRTGWGRAATRRGAPTRGTRGIDRAHR